MTTSYDHIPAHAVFHEIAAKMGLNHPIEALLCAPDRFEDYRVVEEDFGALQAMGPSEKPIVYRARICADANGDASVRGFGRRGAPPPRGGYKDPEKLQMHDPFGWGAFRLEIDVEDALGNRMVQKAFGAVRPWQGIRAGDELVLRGTVDEFFGKLSFGNATFVPREKIGTISPVYLGVPGKHVNTDEVQALINWVCENDERLLLAYQAACDRIRYDCGGLDDEAILEICTPPNSVVQPRTLPDLLTHLHFPAESIHEGPAALEIVRNVCGLSLQCIAQRMNTRAHCENSGIGRGSNLQSAAEKLIKKIEKDRAKKIPGFTLTNNQRDVIMGICSKIQSDTPLNGLLSGEVGSGKTMAYAIPAVAAHHAGARVAIMAPTELLANQIAKNISDDFGPGVSVERVKAGGKIKNQDAILVSTIGLNTAAKKAGYVPDFLILDEQHKLHTAARESMVHPHTHTLDVSATPIPRSLGLSLYGGMDLFTLNEQPVDKDIQTGLMDAKDRMVATSAIRAALRDGKRVAIVYTLVDQAEGTPAASIDAPQKASRKKEEKEAEEKSRKSAIEAAELFAKHLPGQVTLLHGKMSSDEKTAALDDFRSGKKRLMITTTIFETGIDVPEVQVLVVRDPEHLGLSQLHQLRGRLARSGGLGLCLLLTEDLDKLNDETYERLNVFCDTTDGYELATQDMLNRGVGDLDGLQQNGKASTVFKAVKMTTRDLLAPDRERVDLQVQAELINPSPSHGSSHQPKQNKLFA